MIERRKVGRRDNDKHFQEYVNMIESQAQVLHDSVELLIEIRGGVIKCDHLSKYDKDELIAKIKMLMAPLREMLLTLGKYHDAD